MHIKIDHIAKIEGHAGFTADIVDGNITKARLDIKEGARLLEGILRDRSIFEVSQITSRICGVCPVVHSLTSLKALERALKIEVSEQTILLRKLMMMGQILNSHALHLFFFSLSDFFDFKDDLVLIKKYPNRTKDALALREFGNKIIENIGGRSIHPITPTIGGFLKLPAKNKLASLFDGCGAALVAAKNLAKLFAGLKYQNFVRSSPYASLHCLSEYAFYDGLVKTPSAAKVDPAEFMTIIKEHQLQNSAVKYSFYQGKPFMVGALSRLNNNSAQLNPEAKKALKSVKLTLPLFNPFLNILAQAVEMIHCVEEAQKLLRQILLRNLKVETRAARDELIQAKLKAIKGTAKGIEAIEAPRGTLYYFYEINQAGRVVNCNIITPTAQNLARLEKDLIEYLPPMAAKKTPKKEIEAKIKALVRAYDPCLTCATH
ncbi:Ni/Fe hydrogenase subunit alpha [Patescibacteria group bacterium]|nr:Ni/Fe hydrogenase subunit alpha [Patescibacteria group bacterium]MBU2220226.1 Ni/Fe hydrogenase subunit alpha [Patescibacteria group bacterium]MBU2264836.1 Ni/Fe hydrogenase subunit alpha [Patescibacteria group bacterium]